MRRSVKKVRLVFENCQVLDIPLMFVGRFWLEGITQMIGRTHAGAPDLWTKANEFAIEISREFDQEKLELISETSGITWVEITFENGMKLDISLPWQGEEFCENEYQKSKFNKHGDLFVIVSKKKKRMKKVFSGETVNADDFFIQGVDWYRGEKEKAEVLFEYEVFSDCVTILKYIGSGSAIVVPEKIDRLPVTEIGNYAFYKGKFKSASIPASVTYIGRWVFDECKSLERISVDPKNPNFSSEGGVLFNKDKTALLKYPAGNPDTSYCIPRSVTRIDGKAFEYNASLVKVDIPDGVEIIGPHTFQHCLSLAEVNIPNSVKRIEYGAFQNCESLAEITIPDSVIVFGDTQFEFAATGVFEGCLDHLNICCKEGSAAHSYAVDKHISFCL